MIRSPKPKWQREVDNLVDNLNDAIPSTINYEYCMGTFFSHIINETSFSDNTIRIRYVCLSIFTRWLHLNANIHDIKFVNKIVLRQYLMYCKDVRGQQGSMLKCSKVALRTFFSFLYNSKIIPSDPAKNLQISTHINKKNISILEDTEILALINSSKAELKRIISSTNPLLNNKRRIFIAKRNIAIMYVLCSTGIRTEETCLIALKDIEINKGSINIYGKGNNIFLKRYRCVYIDIPDVIDSIKSYLQIRTQRRSKALFCSWKGFPLKSGAIISIVKKLAAKANIQRNVTPMLIRHTFCSNITVNGADPFSVRELMGHKKIHTTLHYYTHFNQNQLKNQMLNFNPLREGK